MAENKRSIMRTSVRSNAIICHDTAESVATYAQYKKTRHWSNLRDRCIESCGGVCPICNLPAFLHIYHVNYDTLGHESIHDVLPICDICYKVAESEPNRIAFIRGLHRSYIASNISKTCFRPKKRQPPK